MICLAILLPCLVGQAFAANSDWSAVQGLAAGQSIQVVLAPHKTLSGIVDHVTLTSLFLQARHQSTEIPRDQIGRLFVKKNCKWAVPVVVGAGAGAAVAGIAGSKTMEHEPGYGGAVAGTAAVGGMIGALVGYLARGSGQTLVYDARR